MDLTVLASSRAPFAVMLGVTVLLTVFAFRLHDRLVYTLDPQAGWNIERLAP